jgi:hypothetical protein
MKVSSYSSFVIIGIILKDNRMDCTMASPRLADQPTRFAGVCHRTPEFVPRYLALRSCHKFRVEMRDFGSVRKIIKSPGTSGVLLADKRFMTAA